MAGARSVITGRHGDVYRIVRQAIETRSPISAVYDGHPRLFCPHRLGRNREAQLRVLCYQYGGTSWSGQDAVAGTNLGPVQLLINSALKPPGSPDNWRCIALDKLSGVKLQEGAWQTAPNHSRPASCVIDADVDAEDYPDRSPQQGQ